MPISEYEPLTPVGHATLPPLSSVQRLNQLHRQCGFVFLADALGAELPFVDRRAAGKRAAAFLSGAEHSKE